MAFQSGVNVWGPVADQTAQRYGLDPALFRAVITQESGWNPNARSGAGAIGLTQVVPRWHPDANLTTPQSQLDYGAKYLSGLLKQYKGSRRDALSAYNSGRPWSVGQGIGETRNYVNTILGHLGSQPTATATQPTGQSTIPAQVASTGGIQVNPQSIADLKAYMAASEKAITTGGGSVDATPYMNRIAGRYRSAPPQVGKQVAGDALQNLGQAALPQGYAGDGATAVQAAQKELGVPYAWGGGGPNGPSRGFAQGANTTGFDCSSLAQWAWAKAGVHLPRTTYDQIKVGTAVPSVAQARPGDLMFPHAGHVQIYIGNGKVIEAPHTGGHVQIVPARPSYIAIRRPA